MFTTLTNLLLGEGDINLNTLLQMKLDIRFSDAVTYRNLIPLKFKTFKEFTIECIINTIIYSRFL